MAVITISGMPGAGKTTAARLLAKKLGYKFYSTGELRGRWAQERGMSIDELNALGMEEGWTDKEADKCQAELAKKEDNIVIESRLGWFFVPGAVKIFLDIDASVGARRIFEAQKQKERGDEPAYKSVDDAQRAIRKRTESDKARYRKYYGPGADFTKKENYDIVIDTTNKAPGQVVGEIIAAMKSRKLV